MWFCILVHLTHMDYIFNSKFLTLIIFETCKIFSLKMNFEWIFGIQSSKNSLATWVLAAYSSIFLTFLLQLLHFGISLSNNFSKLYVVKHISYDLLSLTKYSLRQRMHLELWLVEPDKVFFETEDASHGLIGDRHSLGNVHLVQNDAWVDRKT